MDRPQCRRFRAPSGRVSILALYVVLLAGGAWAQEGRTPPKLSATQPTAEIFDHAWSPKGQLILGIRLYAPSERPFEMGKTTTLKDDTEVVDIFSTKESYLVDAATKRTFHALRRYPSSPAFGRIKSSTTLQPSQTMRFSAAYDFVPPKGRTEPEEFELVLHLPQKVPPLTFTIPNPFAPAK